MSFELFIAKRIYSDTDGRHAVSRPAIRIALIGIAIGLAVMIVSIAVVMGFKAEVSSKAVGFGSHIEVLSITQTHDMELLPVQTTKELEARIRKVGDVVHVQRFVNKMGMLKTNDDFRGLQFKGVGKDYDLAFFRHYLIDGQLPAVSSAKASNQLLISSRISNELGLQTGDKVYAYFVDNRTMRARRFTISGIYETNLTEYDRNIVLTDIYTLRKLNNWQPDESSGFEIAISDFERLSEATDRLIDAVGHTPDANGCVYGVFNVKELVPSIFSWLGVLDMNVVMILVLMLCVASFTVMSGLLIVMLERINMIGLLKALGATNYSVRRIFINFSVMLVGRGMLWGNIAALALCALQAAFHLVSLDPSVYYLDSVPVLFHWPLFIAVNAMTLLISTIVIFGSSYLIGFSKPAKTLQFE